jgi:cystathionine beta-lyase family protein involved in aluminum resistance
LQSPAELVAAHADALRGVFADVDATTQANLRRVLACFRSARVGSHMFAGSTGYGHEDEGRLALDAAFAQLVQAEAALVRPQFFSGTHTIACALYGTLRPGDELLALAGHPYDTLEEVIGLRGRTGDGSLRELGVSYRELSLAPDGGLDWASIERGVLAPNTRCVPLSRLCTASPVLSAAHAEWCSSSAPGATRSAPRSPRSSSAPRCGC